MSKKILFFLTNDYTHYCLSYAFKKKYDYKLYAISEVTSTPRKFFENQEFVKYEKLFFFHDHIKKKDTPPDMEYLKNFEDRYGINLWKLVQNERIFLYYKNFYRFSNNEILNILEQECRFLENILQEIKPDYFFTRIPSLHHQELIFQMCKSMNIKIIAMNYGLLAKRCVLSQDNSELDFHIIQKSSEKRVMDFKEIQNELKSSSLLQQIDTKLVKPQNSLSNKINSMFEYILKFESENTKTHYTYYGRNKTKVLIYYILDYFRDRKRKNFIDKNLVKDSKFNESFVYFPLHMEMERTTLIGAPYFINQIDIIRSVAKSLPINFKLYVKEHPIQILRGWRSKEEYQEIMDIPNVRLFHPDFSNDILYKSCSLVFTIAGTAGFEAACYGKPSIIMVKLNYLNLPSVTLLNNFNELHDLIKNKLKERVSAKDVSEFLNLFKTNASNFDWGGFSQKLSEEFFKNKTRDAQISNKKMELFLKENDQILEDFAEEHFKKIQLFEQEESSK